MVLPQRNRNPRYPWRGRHHLSKENWAVSVFTTVSGRMRIHVDLANASC